MEEREKSFSFNALNLQQVQDLWKPDPACSTRDISSRAELEQNMTAINWFKPHNGQTLFWLNTFVCFMHSPMLDRTTFQKHAVQKVMPKGLVSTPLVDSKEDVLYCFVLLEHVHQHPGLINHDNLLWLCEDVAVIQCSRHLFRFIANFLQSGAIVLPELFSEYEELVDEARMVGMTEFIDALQELSDWKDRSSSSDSSSETTMCCAVEPVYVLSLGLLVQYPDSSLGQLCVQSNLEGSRLYITGNGVLFQHVENWLGTSRLPLTMTAEELPCLCIYLDNQDEVYLAIREAMKDLFHRRETSYMSAMSCSASVLTFTLYKVVKVYVGTHWYATYFKTLIKHPELLSNFTKSKWIVFGESLLVKGDGQMFRHILDFLRCGRLLLPADFREWPLLCQEIETFQIPALTSALQNSSEYRAWCKDRPQPRSLCTSRKHEDISDSSLHIEESVDEYESLSFQRESPDNTLLSSETSSTHSENEAVCVSAGVSGITEVRPPRTEKAERTEEISLTPLVSHSPQVAEVSSSLHAREELLIKNGSKCSPASTACSGSKDISEYNWYSDEIVSISPIMWKRKQEQESSLLERMTSLMETTILSRYELMQMLGPEMSAALITSFCNNWQSCKEQLQSSDTGSAEMTHNTHMNRELSQNPNTDQMAIQGASIRGSVLPISSCTSSVSGCVLTVDHPAVLGRGEAGGYFTQSVIYTDEHPQMMQDAREDGNDVAFAHFSMTYEEMVYARQCHAFLTDTILDSGRSHPNDRIVQLVNHLWTGQMEVDNFVQELLTMIRVSPNKQLEKQERLLQWVKFTLPLAKRYTECVRELMTKTNLHAVSLFPPNLLEGTNMQEVNNLILLKRSNVCSINTGYNFRHQLGLKELFPAK